MKNANTWQNTAQNMRYTTKCMTQSAFQKKILNIVQRAGDKVAEAMNIVDEAGAIAGINVHFERGIRSEQDDHRGEHSRHSDGDLNVNWGSRYDQSNRDEADEADDIDDIDYSDEIKEVTLPELADMVAEKTCFKPECTLCVLNTAFDIMDEQNLMLDLGTISADTSDEDTEDAEEDADDSEYDEEGTDTEDDETYAECGCHDCDNCRHYDDCYGKSDSEYDDSGESSENYGDDDCDDDSEDFNDSYDRGDDDYDDDEITSQPTKNTRNSQNTSRSGREW